MLRAALILTLILAPGCSSAFHTDFNVGMLVILAYSMFVWGLMNFMLGTEKERPDGC